MGMNRVWLLPGTCASVVFFSALLFAAPQARAVEVSIPDPNLEAALRTTLGIPADPLQDTDLALVTIFSAFSGGIADLTGLEYCTNLGRLYLFSNEIVDLTPLAGLTSLTELELLSNQVKDVTPLAGLTNLTTLGLGDNKVTDVSPLAGLANLSFLSLVENQICDLTPLVENAGLATGDSVYVGINPLLAEACETQIPALTGRGVTVDAGTACLSGGETYCVAEPVSIPDPNLEAALRDLLGIPSEPLTYGDLASLTNFFNGGNKGIVDLTGLEYCINLTSLTLSNNQIADLTPISGLTGLTELYLGNNQIADLGPLSGLSLITNLSLQFNQITDLTPLSGLAALTDVNLYNNQIVDLTPLSGLSNLDEVDLSNNQVLDAAPLSGLTSVTYISLDGNQVSSIKPLSDLTSLTLLELRNNQISDVAPLAGLSSLEGLALTGNPVADATPLAGLANLNFLLLDGTLLCDLAPLVAGAGLGSGSFVSVEGNSLSTDTCTNQIPALTGRGVTVESGTACDGGGIAECPNSGEGEGSAEGEGLTEGEGEGIVEGEREGVVEGEGEIDYAVCPRNSLQSQPPDTVSEFVEVRFSDANRSRIVYENFSGLAGPVSGLSWWGFGLDTNNSETECVRDPNTFKVTFYTDGGGAPLTMVDTREITVASEAAITNSGSPTVLRYDVAFDTPIPLTTGWVSIQGINNSACDWVWYPSLEGDELSVEEIVGVSQTIVAFNPAICLSGEATEGEGGIEGEGEGTVDGEGEGESKEGEGVSEGEGEGVTEGEGGEEGEGEVNCDVYNATDLPLVFGAPTPFVTSSIVINDDLPISDLNVRMTVVHAAVGDVSAFLTAPDGTIVNLLFVSGEVGADFTNTLFDDEATTEIADGIAPFTGAFIPENPLGVLDGTSRLGNWSLTLGDAVTFVDDGTLTAWSLEFCEPSGEGEGVTEGEGEGIAEGEGEGVIEGEGVAEGEGEGEGELQDPFEALLYTFASADVDGNSLLTFAEIQVQLPEFTQENFDAADANGDGSLSVPELLELSSAQVILSADTSGDYIVSLSELLRAVQLYNAGGYACAENAGATEDGYEPSATPGLPACVLHGLDQNGDNQISLSELLRGIQLFSFRDYIYCDGQSEDDFCDRP